MSNNIFKMLQGSTQNNILQQFNQMRQTFSGNPQQMVENMLRSGQLSQNAFNQIAQQATELRKMIR